QDGPLYWEYHAFGGMQAVRMGSWKGVRLEIRRQEDSPVLLFDLANDPNESLDIAAEHPDVVAEIRSIMDSRRSSEIAEWNFVRESTP
ncbi:MAG: N-acetylgalactosamine-6-sulfatase, partial [Bacteroidetes bacterium]|nr:N-acetylgalactosamine-6-sulfatase [Bacteroidota bacterium]